MQEKSRGIGGEQEGGAALLGATANLRNSPSFQYSEHKCSCQSNAGAGSSGAVAAFSVSLGRQWCCGGDTPKRIA